MRFVDMRSLILLLALAVFSVSGGASARDKDAALVMDANTGKVLYARNAEEQRYPASLTKMMTLYVLFEAIEKKETELYARMNVSPEAASQKPTRLGLRSGDILTVEDGIKALIIRSANDASVVIAEHLSGTEDRFAVRMTQKARALGMNNTVFRNASGLPDLQQQTTAMDLAILSRRLMSDFPRFFPYFGQRNFTWNGRFYRGHNRLLTHFDGADGLKTGYTRLSGYNLATSASRRGTRLIGIVLGGSSGYNRDVQMAEMLETQYGKLGLGRPPSIVVAMSPLVPDEDEMDGAGSRQLVIESAMDSRPEELTVRPAAANSNAPHLSPVLPRSAAQQPAAAPVAPVGASFVPAVRMSPVVPDEAPAIRQPIEEPVSDVRPPTSAPQRLAALPRPTVKPPAQRVSDDGIASLINKARSAEPAKARAAKPDRRLPARAAAKPRKAAEPKQTARAKDRKPAPGTLQAQLAKAKADKAKAAKPAAAEKARGKQAKTEPKAAQRAKTADSKPAARAANAKKPAAAPKREARDAPKADRKSKQTPPKPATRRIASR
jgi:D-alanyl-D-alanine carboxypeptidase